jgi:CRISPR-associated protein Cmr6
MPILPLYDENQVPTSPGSGHKGLWFDRFFNRYDHNWSIIKADPQNNIEEGKKQWINTVGGLCGDDKQLHTACKRQKELCRQLAGQVLEVKTTWHFATGLGNPHPVENGFAWHPTLGVPYLTGAAVKGLLRAWVEGGWMNCGEGDEAAKRQERLGTLYRWFGSEDMEPGRRKELREKEFIPPSLSNNAPDTEAGMFIFFDAIPVSPVELACDVMTPHYGEWYKSGGEINNVGSEPDKVPADWHSPVPVPFLVVKKAKFLFCIAPRRMPHDAEGKAKVEAELADAVQVLEKALEYLGAGSKTAVGYGRMVVDKAAMDKRKEDAEQARIRELPAEEQMRAEVDRLTADQIATMFGKNFNKTYENRKDVWETFITVVRGSTHAQTIQSWETSKEKNKKKAFTKLTI